MLVDRVLADLDVPADEDRGGNPLRGSRLGRCARQSAYMLFPEAYPPEPLPGRFKLVLAFGTMIHELVRQNFRRVCPGEWGMEEERFYFKVPLSVREAKAAARLLGAPANPTGPVPDTWPRAPLHGRVGRGSLASMLKRFGRAPRGGVYLDLAEPALYIPLHVDGIADTGTGLASCEIKSMTTGGFRFALAGKVGYEYRVQMAAAVAATELDAAIYIAVRKDTSHLLEVFYSRSVNKIAVTFTKQSQIVKALEVPQAEATPMDDWEAARVDHPFEPALLEDARARVKRILLATPTNLPQREYGPSFVCATCDGTGTQLNAKTTGLPLKGGPKPCADCEKADVKIPTTRQYDGGTITTVGGPSGKLAEAELPWQCRYCPQIGTCWADVKPRLAFDREGKPHYWITRKDFEQSGITFKGPEAA